MAMLSAVPAVASAAAGGGAAAGGALAGLGPWMLGSTALSTLGGLFGSSRQSDPNAMAGMYAQLAPINTRLTYAGQELMANMAPYLGAEAAQTNLYGQSMYDIFSGAKSMQSQQAGLQTGIASQLASTTIDAMGLAAKGKPALEIKAGEVQAGLAEKAGDVLGLQYTNLAKGLTDVGTGAANVRNQQVLAQTQANLDVGKALAQIKGQTEGQMALRRQAASTALSPRFA